MASAQKVNDLIKELRDLASGPTNELAKNVKSVCNKLAKALKDERLGPALAEPRPRTVVVTNLKPSLATESGVKFLMSNFGPVSNCRPIEGQPNPTMEVTFASDLAAMRIATAFSTPCGKYLHVRWKSDFDAAQQQLAVAQQSHDSADRSVTPVLDVPGTSMQTGEVPREQAGPQPDHQQPAADAQEHWADRQTEWAQKMGSWGQMMGDWAQKMELWGLKQAEMLYGGAESVLNVDFNTPPKPPKAPTWPTKGAHQRANGSVVPKKPFVKSGTAKQLDFYDGTPLVVNLAPRAMSTACLKLWNTTPKAEMQEIQNKLQKSSAAPLVVKMAKTPRLEDPSVPLLGKTATRMNPRKRLVSPPIAGNAKRRKTEGLPTGELQQQSSSAELEHGEMNESDSTTYIKQEHIKQEPIEQDFVKKEHTELEDIKREHSEVESVEKHSDHESTVKDEIFEGIPEGTFSEKNGLFACYRFL